MAKEKRASVYFDRDLMQFAGFSDLIMSSLRQTYPRIDVDFELKKMGLWLMSDKGIKYKGSLDFISSWLNNAIPRPSMQLESTESPLSPYLNEYRKDLWKNRHHILEMNKIR